VLQDVKDKKATSFYLGKRVAYIYKAKSLKNGSKFRVMWGRIARPHGTNGAVRAKFAKNLPPQALGAPVRVFLYPSNI
jgi:large subunit ribosomal protein L35Ae